MAKIIIWRTESHNIEFSQNDKNQVWVTLKDRNPHAPHMDYSISLNLDDLVGIEKILWDYKHEIQRSQEEKEEGDV